ncbi:hypothetical protein HGI30_13525 [Paenibacillus albicereus]|uniref:Copper amine oxidase-like N-terminal domain-containing protein n=1 Tax=Paenibacillus albicereus TaxID=2726185 RepID=A0A6H2GYI7_9BACL|nr:stalk domain-containing protein [Paenibacillus albicereus]QJC52480.1 hypothetical protein HGI30_13525 [Paenibacillus albicereus]
MKNSKAWMAKARWTERAGRTKKAGLKAVSSVAALSVLAGSGFVFADRAYAGFDYTVIKPKVQVEVLYNARKIETPGGKAQLKDGSVFVPIRAVSETLGAKVAYSGKDVTITKEGRKIQLTIGTKRVVVNDKPLSGIGASFISAGSTMVPIRAISESFGEAVEWDSTNQFVWIGNKDVPKMESLSTPIKGKDFSAYIEKSAYLFMNPFKEGEYVDIYKLSKKDLPVNVGGTIYFRMEKTVSTKGEKFLAVYSTYRGNFPMIFSFLDSGKKGRSRGEVKAMRTLGDKSVVAYFPELASADKLNVGDYSWNDFSVKNPEYVFFQMSMNTSAFVIANPWK